MKISRNWLTQYLPDLGNNDALIAEVLTQGGLEVESVQEFSSVPGGLKGVVVGEVMECQPHPGADRLKLTKVNVGAPVDLSIVCGAPNVAAGQKVLVATIGTKLVFSSGQEVSIQKSKIRGELSEGMICAEDELGIGNGHDGILVLPKDAVPGTPAAEQLRIYNDRIFEIGITPNRSDALSHAGVARDLHACLMARGIKSEYQIPPIGSQLPVKSQSGISIKIESKACIRYAGAIIKGLRVSESPQWLKDRLNAIGVRPINNVVDITNFILHDLGQPLHAFDLQAIEGKTVLVREARQDEKILTLDGVERKLSANHLLICNALHPMCVAGVFGGLNSGVKESTQDVFLESACFDSVSIRKTSKELGLKTDASYRYERGTDPDLVLPAILKAISMLEEIASPVSVEWVDDVYPSVPKPAIVSFSFQRLNEFVGQVIPVAQAKEILLNLGIKILRESGSEAELEIPLFKVDVTREADVFEEILRVYGYNNIGEQSFLRVPVQSQSGVSGLPEKLRDYFSSAGFFEVVNLSMTSEKNLLPGMENLAVRLSNPLSSELSCLRQSLLFGLLENAAFNRNRQAKSIRLFELGRQYFLHPEKKFLEEPRLGVLSGGPANDESWTGPTKEADYFYLKGIFAALTDKLGLKNLRQNTVPSPLGLVTEFSLKSSGQTDWVWRIGPLPSDILKSFSLDGDFTYAEINLPFLIRCGLPWTPAFTELPRFPKVRRDLALLVNQEVSYQQLVDSAYKSESKLLTEVNLFDVYEGKNIPPGKKSYALSFVLYKSDGTLNDSQIEKAMERILKGFREELSAELRS